MNEVEFRKWLINKGVNKGCRRYNFKTKKNRTRN